MSKSFDRHRYKQLSVLGRATLTVRVSDGIHSPITGSLTFYIRRPVAFFAFNARPEPVRNESPLELTGTLKRLAFDSSGQPRWWVPIAGKRVDLYFDRAPIAEHDYRYYTQTTTTSTGTFTRNVLAQFDGCWKPASPETDRWAWRWSARTDCVDVR